MKESQKGEVVTIFTFGALVVVSIFSLFSSMFLQDRQTVKKRADVQSMLTPTPTCSTKLDIANVCNPACCETDADCPQGEVCGVPNGYCVKKKSCAPVAPTTTPNLTPKPKYIRACYGGTTCAWTFCDGKNFPYDQCCDNPERPEDKCLKCDKDDQCRQSTPTPVPNVNKCIDTYGKKVDCPVSYPQCVGKGTAVMVRRDCSHTNDSGCIYWCEAKNGGRTQCGASDQKTFAESSCQGPAFITVTPTPTLSPGIVGEGSSCHHEFGRQCQAGLVCVRSVGMGEYAICRRPTSTPTTPTPTRTPTTPTPSPTSTPTSTSTSAPTPTMTSTGLLTIENISNHKMILIIIDGQNKVEVQIMSKTSYSYSFSNKCSSATNSATYEGYLFYYFQIDNNNYTTIKRKILQLSCDNYYIFGLDHASELK